MKLLLLLLGYYSNHTPFYLYQIPDSTILLFKLSDINTLFDVSDIARHPSLKQVPRGECYSTNTFAGQHDDEESSEQQQEYFLSTQVLSRTAVALNRYRLAELCKLKPNDYVAGLADSILKNLTTFEHTKDEKGWNLMDLPLSPVVSPLPSPKFHDLTGSTTMSTLSNSANHQLDAIMSPPVKSEPLSPPSLRLSQPKDDQRPPNPMVFGKVLWPKTVDRRSPSTRPSVDDDASSNNKRQRIERKVLPKPTHTASLQQSHPSMMNAFTTAEQGPTLLTKRQGKNSRHLTIFAPSYADPLSVAIRSAPLNSNFPQHHQQQQPQKPQQCQPQKIGNNTQLHQRLQQHQQQYPYQNIGTTLTHQGYPTTVRQPPKTATMLQSRHALAPLLSPGANSSQQHSQHHPEPKTAGGAIGKQEFAIPPIVPSQHQPPHTAHPHYSSGNGTLHHGFASSSSITTRPFSHSKPTRLDTTTNDTTTITSMPPQTTPTYSFAALQRQQFLQPFEHLFDTIETTRTLKSTLDDQIRRSSTLLQTLQASSTTVEGIVRGHAKEMQKEMTIRLEQILQSMVKRIDQLESKLDVSDTTTHRMSTTQTAPPPLKSPTAIVKSQNDEGSDGYHSILNTLRERLDRLERINRQHPRSPC